MELAYKRILLKISGEVLAGGKGMGIDYDTVLNICSAVKECVDMGVEVGLVVGGGNFWRGRSSGDMDRTRADHIGMLATVMNSLALADALEHLKVPVRVQTAIAMQQIAEPYIRNRAVRHLEKGRVVIFGCGTGNPGYSIPEEYTTNPNNVHKDGTLAMARSSNPNSAGSQFYFCLGAQPFLDDGYTVFGQTIEGKDVIGQLRVGDVIEKIEIENANE